MRMKQMKRQQKEVEVDIRLPKEVAAHYAKVAELAGEPVEVCIKVAMALVVAREKGQPSSEVKSGTGAPAQPPVVSVDADGIITTHRKADVWPYDDENTAVQVDTPYGYVLVRVQRYDRPSEVSK